MKKIREITPLNPQKNNVDERNHQMRVRCGITNAAKVGKEAFSFININKNEHGIYSAMYPHRQKDTESMSPGYERYLKSTAFNITC